MTVECFYCKTPLERDKRLIYKGQTFSCEDCKVKRKREHANNYYKTHLKKR